jgi:hypothetical protein
MAMIKCTECGASISDKAKSCIQCGCPINADSKVMIYGYTQIFLINPKVEVTMNGKLMGYVQNGDLLEIPISENAVIDFKCHVRTSHVTVYAGRVTKIKITWNRLTGKMVPKIVE